MKSPSAPACPVSRRPRAAAWRGALLPVVAAVLLGLPAVTRAQTITSAVPGLITYQGKVTNANGTAVGAGTPVNRTVIFRIWSHPSNSTVNDLIYSEQQTVTISEGEFSVLIGQGLAVPGTPGPLGYAEGSKGPPTLTFNNSFTIFGGALRYLGVTVDDGTAAADPEISPRQQIVSTAYAMRARYAEGLGSNGGFSVAVTDQGNFGVGLANPAFPVTTAAVLGDKIGLFGNFNYGLGIQNSLVQLHGASASDDIAFGYGPSAAMTETMRVKGNGNVGIGIATPTAKLEVNGAINVIDGGSKSFAAGMATEVGASIFNIGINDARMGVPQNNASQGGFLRFDARGGSNLVGLYARSAGGAGLAEVLSITSAGNVGIGNGGPSAKLHVGGGIKIDGTNVIEFGAGATKESNAGKIGYNSFTADALDIIGAGTTGLNRKIKFWNEGGAIFNGAVSVSTGVSVGGALDVTGTSALNGKVGIGTAAPTDMALMVQSSTASAGNNTAVFRAAGINSGNTMSHVHYGTTGDIYWRSAATNGKVVLQDSGGRVGVGTSDPIAPLHVAGSAHVPAYQRLGYMYQHGASASDDNNITGPYGLVVDGYIRTPEVDINSDARIKEIMGRSSGANDLAALQRIEITDYRFRDQVARGSRPVKKVIAQQVEQVYPAAVRQTKDVVPDMMAKAEVKDGWIVLATTLQAGERVRLMIGDRWEMREVIEAETTRFRVALPPATEQVFAYGREVSDFRVVDYDAIAMLNVSATQEIKREKDAEVAALRAENASLRERLAAVEGRDRDYAAKFAALEKMVRSASTAMAQPAKPAAANGQE